MKIDYSALATPDSGEHLKRECPDAKEGYEDKRKISKRTAFQRDKDRILYSKAFRRTMHKTQVCVIGEMNEHLRTRLTHTLEVSQIARSIARDLGLNVDLAEAIALGHDVGHTPFGHAGERVLLDFLIGEDKKIAKDFELDFTKINMGFKHNFQSVRILTEIEKGYYGITGLNLTYPVLEGILKHTKMKVTVKKENKDEIKRIEYENITNNPKYHMDQDFSCSIEGQIVALADEIAQVSHDLEDAIEANYESDAIIRHKLNELIKIDEIQDIKAQKFIINTEGRPSEINEKYFKNFISYIIGQLIYHAVTTINKNIEDYIQEKRRYSINSPIGYPITANLATEEIVFKDYELYHALKEIKDNYITNNYKINMIDGKARFIIRRLIKAYLTNPKQLPDSYLKRYSKECNIESIVDKIPLDADGEKNIRYLNMDLISKNLQAIRNDPKFLRTICDYIASMTDNYAIEEYQRLYSGDIGF